MCIDFSGKYWALLRQQLWSYNLEKMVPSQGEACTLAAKGRLGSRE